MYILGDHEHNGLNTELYGTKVKSQDLIPLHFAIISITVVHEQSRV